MLQVEKQRLFEKNIAKLVSDSFFDEDDIQKWIHAKDINCYAFARGLTYPDSKHEIYTPGKIYNLMYGTNKCIKNEYKPNLVHPYLVLDSKALGQTCTRVSFKSINENDGNFYFAITNFHPIYNKNDHQFHFICKTPNGLCLNKPNWFQNVEPVSWTDYGKTFQMYTLAKEVSSTSITISSSRIKCEGICFEDYFYKLELPEL